MPPTPPDAWTGGDVRLAKKLRDPTVRHEIRGGVIRLRRLPPLPAANDTAARYVPPDCDPTYGDEEPEVPPPVAETSREARRALMAVYVLGAVIVVGLLLALVSA